MTTRPKKTEQSLIADARHVAGTARRHFDLIEEVDAQREKKLLSEERLARFESNIEAFAAASGGSVTGLALQAQATLSEAARRGVLYPVLRDVRADIKLTYAEDPAIGRAYGVGLPLSPLSTPSLLKVGGVVLSSWKDPGLRLAAERAGIGEARINVIAEHVAALTTADMAQNAALAQGRGRTMTKAQLSRAVRRDTVYVRNVAAVVFREHPAMLTEFASTQPRRAVKSRTDTGGAAEGVGAAETSPESSAPAEEALTPEAPVQS